MADHDPLSDSELDALFGAARRARPVPSEALAARILADADAERAARRPAVPAPPAPALRGRLMAAIGGWPAAAGLAAATVAGLAIGITQPAGLDDLAAGYLATGDYAIDVLMPSYADLLDEG